MNELLERRIQLLGKKSPIMYDEPLHLVRGEGVWLFDTEGKRYLDAFNNVPCVGHCHPHVVEALTKQASMLNTHTRYLHDNIVAYGEKLTSLMGDDLSMLYLLCTGSEANELALRMVRETTAKQGIICFDHSYHGNTRSVFDLASAQNKVSPNPAVKYVPFPEMYRPIEPKELEQDASLADAYIQTISVAIEELEFSQHGFAAILMCPIFANEGLPDVPEGFWQKLRNLVDEKAAYIIFDEVHSAFGRTGKLWGKDWTGISPDIVTLGKPMGNGHPIAGLVAKRDLVHAFQNEASYFNTFGGNPVSCAAAMAVLEVIEQENIVENAAETGQYLYDGLKVLMNNYDVIGDIRAKGLYLVVEIVKDRESKKASPEAANFIVNSMRQNGVLLSRAGRYWNVLKIRPPLVFSKENADLLLTKFEYVLQHLDPA